MDVLKDYAKRSTIHGINELFRAESIRNKIFWAIALIGVACFIPLNLISLLQSFRHAPTITLISRTTDENGYPFPVIRFCPRAWVNATRLAQSDLSKDGFVYALSLLYHVIVKENVTDLKKAESDLHYHRKNRKIPLKQVYKNAAYDVRRIFECTGCENMTAVMTIAGVCYDFTYGVYQPEGVISRYISYHLRYYPPEEDYSDPRNPNNWFNSIYSSDIMHVDVNTHDFFAFDPLYMDINRSYEITVMPAISVRLPGRGQKQCQDEVNQEHSFDQCQLDCTESLYGGRCRGYMYYGLATDSARTRENLSWHSSLREYDYDKEKIDKCDHAVIDELMKCLNVCYSACRQWQYDILVAETNRPWTPLPPKAGPMTAAKYFAWRRQYPPNAGRYVRGSFISIIFLYEGRHGAMMVEERSRQTLAAFISNVGGMMGLVAGASALSLWQLGECIVHVFMKRFSVVREGSYSLSGNARAVT